MKSSCSKDLTSASGNCIHQFCLGNEFTAPTHVRVFAAARVLKIDTNLTWMADTPTIFVIYQHYLESLRTLSFLATGVWPSGTRSPTKEDVHRIFVGHTQYSKWQKIFFRLQSYPELKAWINQDEDAPPTEEIWGTNIKPKYSLDDIKDWMDNKDKKGKAVERRAKKAGKS